MSTTLHLRENGKRSGNPLVFIHGFMGSSDDFSNIISKLKDKHFCITVDLPGHGNSLFKKREELHMLKNLESVAGLIIEDLERIGVIKFSLYGYSMGGRIAQGITVREPARITRLILESASFGIINLEERESRYREDMEMMDKLTSIEEFHEFLQTWHEMPLFKTLKNSDILPGLIRDKQKNRLSEIKRAMNIMSTGNHPDYRKKLDEAGTDICYLYGEEDSRYSLKAEDIPGCIRNIRLFPFKKASHNIHVQFPLEVAALIESIMSG